METNLSHGMSSDYFEWGKVPGLSNPTYSKSSLGYRGLGFSNITTGQRFEIGVLEYRNGAILSNTGADFVSFAIDLNLSVGGLSVAPTFDFGLELVNVANRGNSPWEDADFVRLANPTANQIVSFNGIDFQLQIEFGEIIPLGVEPGLIVFPGAVILFVREFGARFQ